MADEIYVTQNGSSQKRDRPTVRHRFGSSGQCNQVPIHLDASVLFAASHPAARKDWHLCSSTMSITNTVAVRFAIVEHTGRTNTSNDSTIASKQRPRPPPDLINDHPIRGPYSTRRRFALVAPASSSPGLAAGTAPSGNSARRTA